MFSFTKRVKTKFDDQLEGRREGKNYTEPGHVSGEAAPARRCSSWKGTVRCSDHFEQATTSITATTVTSSSSALNRRTKPCTLDLKSFFCDIELGNSHFVVMQHCNIPPPPHTAQLFRRVHILINVLKYHFILCLGIIYVVNLINPTLQILYYESDKKKKINKIVALRNSIKERWNARKSPLT